ncbi:hypothetical protein [Microbulbifer sp. THAF38]|uniref:hypothetical protein n=1 Tax=Microbulbifer sp. THAF38 TaxID=2587856 RepID=UPI001267F3D4|nr:hypothetical protein [Microbulbifer sp. THAF38]QFT54468.1 hypothetical protein FIU95_07875 [Microbulbifer sp. THAF38]
MSGFKWADLSEFEQRNYLFRWFWSEIREEGEVNLVNILKEYPPLALLIPEIVKDVAELLCVEADEVEKLIVC